MTDLSQLIERIEAADGPDREIDRAIMSALGFVYREEQRSIGLTYGKAWDMHLHREWVRGDEIVADACVPNYSKSIDAAMTLVPNGLEWELFGYDAKRDPRFGCFQARIKLLRYEDDPEEPGPESIANAATPALALSAAALRAIQSGKDEK